MIEEENGMTSEEFEQLVKGLKAQGATDEDILSALLNMFDKGELEQDDLAKFASTLGYELTPEFIADAKGTLAKAKHHK